MDKFLESVYEMIDPAIENYMERDFTSLLVSFGCTGGQHRSVYAAERLREHINSKYPNVKTELKHIELEKM